MWPLLRASSGISGGRRGQTGSWGQIISPLCPLLPVLAIWWEQTYRVLGGEDRDAGITPAWKRDREQRGREGRDVTVRSQRSQSLLLFLASLCVSKVTGKAEESTSFTPSCTRGPRIETMWQTDTDTVFTMCLRATRGHWWIISAVLLGSRATCPHWPRIMTWIHQPHWLHKAIVTEHIINV